MPGGVRGSGGDPAAYSIQDRGLAVRSVRNRTQALTPDSSLLIISNSLLS